MARTRILADKVLRVSGTLLRRIPGVVSATTGVDSAGVASATGCTINVADPRSPWNKAHPGSIKNTDGTTADTWDFTSGSGLKLSTTTTLAAASNGTVSKPAGKFIISTGRGGAGKTYTLTNTYIGGATSIVDAQIESTGDTATILSIVPADGSAVFTLSADAAVDLTISFVVING